MRFSRTPFDDEWDRLVMKMLKKNCTINPTKSFSQFKKLSWWHEDTVVNLKYKKWRIAIHAPKKAKFVKAGTEEQIELRDYYQTDDEVCKALEKDLIEMDTDNWYQYYIYNDKDEYLGGDLVHWNDIMMVLDLEGEGLCDVLIAKYDEAHPEEVKRKKTPIKLRYSLAERVEVDPFTGKPLTK